MKISLIAAIGENRVIGSKGDLPWRLPDDMKYFSSTTRGHYVLMGRKNYDSIPAKYRPLPDRPNIVVTRNNLVDDSRVHVVNSIDEGIKLAQNAGEKELFIIGGGEIYRQTIELADKLYITHIDAAPIGDTHFPDFKESKYSKTIIEHHPKDDVHNFSFTICVYDKN